MLQKSKLLASLILLALFAANTSAQTSATPQQTTKSGAEDQKTKKKKSTANPPDKLEAMQGKLDQAQAEIQQQQTEIQQLQKSLQDSVAVLQQQQQQLQLSVQRASDEASAARDSEAQADMQLTNAKSSFLSVNESLQAEDRKVSNLEDPSGFHYKGVTFTPGGFLETTALVRTRNENADIASSWTLAPLNGSSNSKLSEFRGSARNSRLTMLMQANAGNTKLTGFVATDFLGTTPASNYVQSSSFVPRLREAWFQLGMDSGWTITAGQFYSLLATNREGLSPLTRWGPMGAEANDVVGYSYVRERSVRVTKDFHNGIWAAFEVDDPENTFSAAFVPANIMGLNTSQNASSGINLLPFLANYSSGDSTTRAPDFLGKVVFEPGWGHFEIKALGRIFRDRVASTATTTGHDNYSQGYGFGFAAILPVVRGKMDFIAEGLVGQGIGRYSSTGLADVTLNPTTGAMRPLRDARIMGGIEYHPTTRIALYAYAGNEYVGRYAYTAVDSTGAVVPAGYGSPLISYAACTSEVALNTCNGANNRDIYDVTVGYRRTLLQGEFGKFEYGNQVEYMHRSLWSGIGRTPQGEDLVILSTGRWYLP